MKKRTALRNAMVALPFTMAPALHAQDTLPPRPSPTDQTVRAGRPSPSLVVCCIKFAERYSKQKSSYTVVGTDKQHPIYQNAGGEYFYLDPATGDMIFLSPDAFTKWRPAALEAASPAQQKMMKQSTLKGGEQVTILGIDQAGHVIQRNVRGEAFYLDPSTGDMTFVK
jgi:hypothetical protein